MRGCLAAMIQIECRQRPVKDLYCCLSFERPLEQQRSLSSRLFRYSTFVNADRLCESVNRFLLESVSFTTQSFEISCGLK